LRDSLPIDMILSAVYVLVVAQSSSGIPEGLMNNPVHTPLSRTLTPIVLVVPLQSSSKKNSSQVGKNTGGQRDIVPFLLLQDTPMPF